jgi:hypothetical protein
MLLVEPTLHQRRWWWCPLWFVYTNVLSHTCLLSFFFCLSFISPLANCHSAKLKTCFPSCFFSLSLSLLQLSFSSHHKSSRITLSLATARQQCNKSFFLIAKFIMKNRWSKSCVELFIINFEFVDLYKTAKEKLSSLSLSLSFWWMYPLSNMNQIQELWELWIKLRLITKWHLSVFFLMDTGTKSS